MQTKINLNCDINLKILSTVEVYSLESEPPRDSNKKKKTAAHTVGIGDLQIPSHPRTTKYNNPPQSTWPFEGVFALLPITNIF